MRDMTENELKKHDFWFVGTKANPKLMVYETASNLLWLPVAVQELFNCDQSIRKIKTNLSPIGEPTSWRLPMPVEIMEFASHANNPLGQKPKLLGFYKWITQHGSLHLSTNTLSKSGTGHILACSEILKGKHLTDILWLVQSKAMQLTSTKTEKILQLSDEQFLALTEKRINAQVQAAISVENAKLKTAEANIIAAQAVAFAEQRKAETIEKEKRRIETRAARDAELNKMLNQLMENTVGSLCQSYLNLLAENTAQYKTLQKALKQKS